MKSTIERAYNTPYTKRLFVLVCLAINMHLARALDDTLHQQIDKTKSQKKMLYQQQAELYPLLMENDTSKIAQALTQLAADMQALQLRMETEHQQLDDSNHEQLVTTMYAWKKTIYTLEDSLATRKVGYALHPHR
jgi:hypothetical protein